MKKVIPELHDIEEPEMKSPVEIKAEQDAVKKELAALEAAEEAEDAKFDEAEDEEDVPMTEAEIASMTTTIKEAEKTTTKAHGAKTTALPVKPGKQLPGTNATSKSNTVTAEKTLLYSYPTVKEWAKIHTLKPQKIIFYFTMTKEQYKEFFLCKVKYGTKIIGSTGAKVV